MSATTADVYAATTAEAPPVADANEEPPKSADSAPAVTNPDENEDSREVLNPVGKRIDELTRRRYDAERRAEDIARDRDEWRDRALRVEKPATVEDPPAAGKKLADFGYDEDKYQEYLFGQAEARAVKAAESVMTRKQTETARVQTITAHKEREAEFAKKVPDYFEVAHYAPITDSMAEIVMELDQSAELAYHLGKNPKVAAQIARLPERQQALELGKIVAKLSDVPKPPQVSTAPAPAPKIAAGNPQVEKDPKDWTDKDFAKWRAKHS
jgi:hypothetical protein